MSSFSVFLLLILFAVVVVAVKIIAVLDANVVVIGGMFVADYRCYRRCCGQFNWNKTNQMRYAYLIFILYRIDSLSFMVFWPFLPANINYERTQSVAAGRN